MIKLPSSARITNLSFEIDRDKVNDLSEFTGVFDYETLELNGQEYLVLEMNWNPVEKLNTEGLLIKPKRIIEIDLKVKSRN